MPREKIASLLRSRPLCFAVAGAAVLQVTLTALGLGGWPCPFRSATGLPCPGCGLTRGVIALLQGDFSRAVHLHAFSPLALAGAVALGASALLPRRLAERISGGLAAADGRFMLSTVLLGMIVLYWIARLMLDF